MGSAIYTVIRKDLATIIKADPKLDRSAKLTFLAISIENHGLSYTNIDYRSMEEGWGIKKDMLNKAINDLEKGGYLINGNYGSNRTKQKSVAKYIGISDSGKLKPLGHKITGDVAVIQKDVLKYKETHVSSEEMLDIPDIDFYYVDGVSGIQSDTSDIQNRDSGIPNEDSDIQNHDSDIQSDDSDIPSTSSDIPKLRRKENNKKEEIRSNGQSLSLFPKVANHNIVDSPHILKSLSGILPNSHQGLRDSEVHHYKKMLALVDGEENKLVSIIKEVYVSGYYSDIVKDKIVEEYINKEKAMAVERDSDRITALIAEKNLDGPYPLMCDNSNKIRLWKTFMDNGDDIAMGLMDGNDEINEELTEKYIYENGKRFN